LAAFAIISGARTLAPGVCEVRENGGNSQPLF
jgi:hypothetical protein